VGKKGRRGESRAKDEASASSSKDEHRSALRAHLTHHKIKREIIGSTPEGSSRLTGAAEASGLVARYLFDGISLSAPARPRATCHAVRRSH